MPNVLLHLTQRRPQPQILLRLPRSLALRHDVSVRSSACKRPSPKRARQHSRCSFLHPHFLPSLPRLLLLPFCHLLRRLRTTRGRAKGSKSSSANLERVGSRMHRNPADPNIFQMLCRPACAAGPCSLCSSLRFSRAQLALLRPFIRPASAVFSALMLGSPSQRLLLSSNLTCNCMRMSRFFSCC